MSLVYLRVPGRETAAAKIGGLTIESRRTSILPRDRARPQLTPPMANRDTGCRYGLSKRPALQRRGPARCGRRTGRATGASIPLLALNWTGRSNNSEADFPESSAASSESGSPVIGVRKSSGAPVGPTGPMGVLDLAAGLERFHAQAAGIALYIEAFRADQAIWLGVMGALGYPRNKRAFRMLATRVPWSMVAACGSSQ